jgi:hypothetical protein
MTNTGVPTMKQMGERKERFNFNSMNYWYPKIKDLVPTPKTEIIPIEWSYGKNGEIIKIEEKAMREIEEKSKQFKFPIFVRGDNGSGKHEWENTCFVKEFKDLREHVRNLIYWSTNCDVFGGIPCNSIALREFIDMDTGFTAFWGKMPVNPERRYFVKDGKLICHHPYWIEDAIRNPSIEDWKGVLKEINKEFSEEIEQLTIYAEQIAKFFEGYWSVDFCRSKDGTWYVIDMARGEDSWHPDCPNKIIK